MLQQIRDDPRFPEFKSWAEGWLEKTGAPFVSAFIPKVKIPGFDESTIIKYEDYEVGQGSFPLTKNKWSVVGGHSWEKTPEEAVAAFKKYEISRKEIEQARVKIDTILEKIKIGNYTSIDLHALLGTGYNNATGNQLQGFLRQMGMRPTDALKLIKKIAPIETTKSGIFLYDPRTVFEKARSMGFIK